jgi:hypothetical protein
MAKDFTPVFIGGSGRSGTTIALNLLSRHPEFHASMPREIKYLTSRHGLIDLAYSRPMRFEENLKSRRNNFAARLLPIFGLSKISSFEKELFGPWWSETGKKGTPRGLVQGISYDVLEHEFNIFRSSYATDPIATSRQLFESLSWAQMKNLPKKYFGDSTPVNMMQADLIHDLLPQSKFINVIRDGRDVATSVVKEKWGPNRHNSALYWWKNRITKANLALGRVPLDQVLEIRIEDLVIHKREVTLFKILDFLNLESHPRVERYFSQEILPERLHAGRWQNEVSHPAKFEKLYEENLKQLADQGIIVEKL